METIAPAQRGNVSPFLGSRCCNGENVPPVRENPPDVGGMFHRFGGMFRPFGRASVRLGECSVGLGGTSVGFGECSVHLGGTFVRLEECSVGLAGTFVFFGGCSVRFGGAFVRLGNGPPPATEHSPRKGGDKARAPNGPRRQGRIPDAPGPTFQTRFRGEPYGTRRRSDPADGPPKRDRELRSGSLRLFGSVARGEAAADSDVDLLVSFRQTPTFSGYMKLRIFLEDLLGARVDLITESGLREGARPFVEKDAIPVS